MRRPLLLASITLVAGFQQPASAGLLVLADEAPQPVTVAIPRYPFVALQARVSGSTRIALEVDPQGVPVRTTPQGPRIALLTDACVTALSEWRFSPARGTPTRSAVVTCTFRLVSRADPEPLFVARLTIPGLVEIAEWEPLVQSSGATQRAPDQDAPRKHR